MWKVVSELKWVFLKGMYLTKVGAKLVLAPLGMPHEFAPNEPNIDCPSL